MNTCRLCKGWEDQRSMVKYGVRHYAHTDCAFAKWGAGFFDRLTSWQVEQLPYFALVRHGMLDEAKRRTGKS